MIWARGTWHARSAPDDTPHPPAPLPCRPLLLAVWAGAAGVLWLWWHNTPSIGDDTSRILNAGRITGLLAGYLMALVVLQMARVPALERRVGSDRVARWHAMSGRHTLCLVVAHVFLTMWGHALQAGGSLGDIVQQTIDAISQLPDMGEAAIGAGLLVLIGLTSIGGIRRRVRDGVAGGAGVAGVVAGRGGAADHGG